MSEDQNPNPNPRKKRTSLGPVLLLGLAGGGLAALAGSRAWATGEGSTGWTQERQEMAGIAAGTGEVPLAATLAMVVLAAWGVVLVTRGRVRVALTWLNLVAAVGLLATVVVGLVQVRDTLRVALEAAHLPEVEVAWTVWGWFGLLGAVVALVAALGGVRGVRSWPEMGSRYDAPTGQRSAAAEEGAVTDTTNLDLWKSLDEGHDPTADPAPDTGRPSAADDTRPGPDPTAR